MNSTGYFSDTINGLLSFNTCFSGYGIQTQFLWGKGQVHFAYSKNEKYHLSALSLSRCVYDDLNIPPLCQRLCNILYDKIYKITLTIPAILLK
jgi:hypothetical protein